MQDLNELTLTARRFNLVADSGTRWHEFLHNPGKRMKAFWSRQSCPDGSAKTMTAERRPAALLTLSRQQDESRYHKI